LLGSFFQHIGDRQKHVAVCCEFGGGDTGLYRYFGD
jgi:hypothetical protein